MYINQDAKEIFHRDGINDDNDNVKVIIWEGYTGARSFRSTLTRWIKVWYNGKLKLQQRFTGRNINKPIDFKKDCIECIHI